MAEVQLGMKVTWFWSLKLWALEMVGCRHQTTTTTKDHPRVHVTGRVCVWFRVCSQCKVVLCRKRVCSTVTRQAVGGGGGVLRGAKRRKWMAKCNFLWWGCVECGQHQMLPRWLALNNQKWGPSSAAAPIIWGWQFHVLFLDVALRLPDDAGG